MINKKRVLTRDVKKSECSWLDVDMKKGEIVYLYTGCTYGCCRDEAYTYQEGKTPFFELPNDAVKRGQ